MHFTMFFPWDTPDDRRVDAWACHSTKQHGPVFSRAKCRCTIPVKSRETLQYVSRDIYKRMRLISRMLFWSLGAMLKMLSYLLFYYFLLLLCFGFGNRVAFCSLGWPLTHYVDQAGHKLKRSACLCLLSIGLKVCTTPFLKKNPARWWWQAFNPSTGRQRQVDLCEFKANLVYKS